MASVQILMAVYNGERYLGQQIESILNQSFQDWELLISDDCSTDRSLDLIKLYCERDSRIRLVLDGSHFGSAKSHFMALFRTASAPYVMTADQDDVWDNHKIELTLNKMKESEIKSSGPVLVCTDLRVVDQDLNLISPSFLRYSALDASKIDLGYFLASCLVTGCTMMINHQLLLLLQRKVDTDSLIMHDWWASLVAAAFGNVVYIPEPTISYRQHFDNSVGAVKFSLLQGIKTFNDRRKTESEAITQAEELVRVYPDLITINSEIKTQIESFIAIKNSGVLNRISLMNRADIWRKGILRNAVTFFSLLTIG